MFAQALAPALLVPLFGFVLYRRVRRNIGRQSLRPTQLTVRIAMLALATVMIATSLARGADLQLWLAAGTLPGIALAIYGLKLTRFEISPQGSFYTPNPYLGIAISMVLIARIVYRMIQVWPAMQSARQAAEPGAMTVSPLAMSTSTPITMALLGLVIGYYIAYCVGLLRHARGSAPAA
jgi:hypothetical protein